MKLHRAVLPKHFLLGTALAPLALLVACSPNPGGSDASTPAEEASWNECAGFIQSKFGVSSTSAPTFNTSNVNVVQKDQFIVTMYYGSIGTLYRCSLKQSSDGSWQLVTLNSLVPNELTVFYLKK